MKSKIVKTALLVFFTQVLFTTYGQFNQQEEKLPKGQLLPYHVKQRSSSSIFTKINQKPDKNAPVVMDKLSTKSEVVSKLFEENFESSIADWSIMGDWEVGVPTSGPKSGYKSTKCAATVLDGDYADDSDYRLITSTIVLPELTNPKAKIELIFNEWFSIESNYDFGKIELSKDNGINWILLDSRSGTSDWVENIIDITSYHGQSVKIAFHFTSDNSLTYAGWYVDNVVVQSRVPSYLDCTINNLSAQNFPFIYMNVAVNANGNGISPLNETNFSIIENGIKQTDFFEVIPPAEGGGSRLADIIFVLDVSGSMADEIMAVKNNMADFIMSLDNSGVDYGIGFMVFGDIFYAYNNSNLYYDKNTIISIINNIRLGEHGIGDGGDTPENQLGTMAAAAMFNFRPGSQRIQIMLTDAYSHENNYVTSWNVSSLISDRLVPNNISVYPVFNTQSATQIRQYKPIAEATSGGKYFHVYDNFNSIIDDISTSISNTYLVKFRSLNPKFDGVKRNIVVDVNYESHLAQDTISYIPGALPVIELSRATKELENKSWAEYTPFTIEVIVKDNVFPFVQEVTLFYKQSSGLSYNSVLMTQTNDTIWTGIIPASSVISPGVDYYITASDGQGMSSLPKTTPAQKPFQIAILPNSKPLINHLKVTEFKKGAILVFDAHISDNTNKLDSIAFFIRNVGHLSYSVRPMTNVSGDLYRYQLQTTEKDSIGIEYYIAAWDDFGVTNSVGSADFPVVITYKPPIPPEIYHIGMSEYHVGHTILFETNVTDIDGYIKEVKVFHKYSNESAFNELKLNNSNGSKFENYIISDKTKEDNFVYYIVAIDDDDLSKGYGSEDNPFVMWPVWTFGFDPAKNGWSFSNYSNNLWPKEWWSQFDYSQIPPYHNSMSSINSESFPDWPLFKEVFGEDACYLTNIFGQKKFKPSAVEKWKSISKPSIDKSGPTEKFRYWRGSCFGFAISSYMAFDYMQEFNNAFPAVGLGNELYKLERNDTRAKCINNLQISQFGMEHKLHQSFNVQKKPNATLEEIKSMLCNTTRDDKVIIINNQNGSGSHAVNAYRVDKDMLNYNIEYIYIYDSNYEGDNNRKITIDKDANTWSYSASINSSGKPEDWGGSKGFYLMEPVSNYFKTPTFHTTNKIFDFLELFYQSSDKVNIKNSLNQSIGYKDSVTYNEMSNGMPIIPITGSFHEPIGYFLAKDNYSISLSEYVDTTMSVTLFNDSVIYSYSRNGCRKDETDSLNFGVNVEKKRSVLKNSSLKVISLTTGQESRKNFSLTMEDMDRYGMTVINSGEIAKENVDIKTVLIKDTLEQVFTLLIDSLKYGDEIFVNSVNKSNLLINNLGKKKEYMLAFQHVTSDRDTAFVFPNKFSLGDGYTHLIKPVTQSDSFDLKVFIDTDNDGVFNDSLYVLSNPTKLMPLYKEDLKVTIYPNPADSKVEICFDAGFSRTDIEVKLLNSIGQLVGCHNLEIIDQKCIIDISEFNPGVYLIAFNLNDRIVTRKIVKK